MSGGSPPSLENLEAVTAPGTVITRQARPAAEQALLIGKLARQIALERTVERALLARRVLLTGMRDPHVSATPAPRPASALPRPSSSFKLWLRMKRNEQVARGGCDLPSTAETNCPRHSDTSVVLSSGSRSIVIPFLPFAGGPAVLVRYKMPSSDPRDPIAIKIVPLAESREDVKDQARTRRVAASVFPITLPEIPNSVFPIASKEDLETKISTLLLNLDSLCTESATGRQLFPITSQEDLHIKISRLLLSLESLARELTTAPRPPGGFIEPAQG